MLHIPILIILASYAIGCFSTARVVAKSAKSLNIYRVGTGHADSENIYCNVSRPLGLLVGAIDAGKIYLWLLFIRWLLTHAFPVYADMPQVVEFSHRNWMLVYGFMMIVGHTLPVTHKFKGGRGIFTYSGFVAYFALYPMAAVAALASFLLFRFHQVRFAQYMIVLLPPIVIHICNRFFHAGYPSITHMLIAAILMGVLNFLVSKQKGEI